MEEPQDLTLNREKRFSRSCSNVSSHEMEYQIPLDNETKLKLILRYGEYCIQGKRKTQEDNHTCLPDITKNKNGEKNENTDEKFSFFGVFDGHGGQMASDFVAENLHKYLLEEKRKPEIDNNLEKALISAFMRVEVEFLSKALTEDLKDGTTAIVAIINENKLIVGNIGDSELIICNSGKPISLCPVHNPKRNQKEVERIEAEGGKLYNDRLAHPSLNPAIFNIAVSRAIGDIFFKHKDYTKNKPSALTATPDIVSYTLSGDDDFAVLACDGLWDVMSHQDVVEFVLPRLKDLDNPQEVTRQLVEEAFKRGSQDNITTLIITFKHFLKD